MLLAPGLSAFRRLLEPEHRVLELPETDLPGFLAGEGQAARALIAGGTAPVDLRLAALPAFGLVAVVGSGYEGIDVEALARHGVAVANTPNVNHEDVADHAVGLLLSLIRRIQAGDGVVRAGLWRAGRHPPPTRSMRTLAVGVVGLGAIGLALARRLEGFGCRIAWWGPRSKADIPYPRRDSLLALAGESDVLVLCHRAGADNQRMVGVEVLEALGPRGYLVNVSRGSAVDEDALIAALRDGRVAGAALDVFAEEPTPKERWEGVPNVVLTPHTAGGGDASLRAMTKIVLDNLRRHLAGEPLATLVAPRGYRRATRPTFPPPGSGRRPGCAAGRSGG